MSSENPNIERRLDELAREVAVLTERLDQLTSGLAARNIVPPSKPARNPEPPPVGGWTEESHLRESDEPELPFTIPGLLSGVATISFLLVIALILRTLSDSKIINQSFGAALGLSYACGMILYGCRRYARALRLAPIYVGCGLLLWSSIILETHARFHILSTSIAFLLLGASLTVTAGIGLRLQSALPICLGVLGASLTGLVLDFQRPVYPALALLLLLANGAAHRSAWIPRCAWLRWMVLAVTLFFWLSWSVRAYVAVVLDRIPAAEMALPWILPFLGLFAAASLLAATLGVVRKNGAVGIFDTVQPAMIALMAAGVGLSAATPYFGASRVPSFLGVGLGLLYLIAAACFLGVADKGSRAAPGLATGALILLAACLPGCTGNIPASVVLCSSIAVALTIAPPFAHHRPAALLSHLFQSYACIVAVVFSLDSAHRPATASPFPTAVLPIGLCLAHYVLSDRAARRFARANPDRIDPAGYTTVFPLGAGLVYLFGAAQAVLAFALQGLPSRAEALLSGESAIVNLGALALAFAGLLLMRREMLALAVVLALAGGAKVFAYDLTHLHGVPLVLSIFSFGVTAALGSVLWNRWQHAAIARKSAPISVRREGG